ncbi:MAG: glycosyltransferase [Candidatus Omnitrophica bacterium]|nr:glycosyltransferase [Candidatus Omnitrophota bacterium]MBU1810777.1 glycosyltransferase [Candidatus Omnitrophota bacterium]
MRVALIYNKECECTIGIFIEKVIKNAGIACTHFWTKDSHTIPKEFDLYFRIDHGDYKYDIPKDLHPSIFYAIDTHLKKPYKKIKQQASHFDFIFCAQREGKYRLRKETKADIQWIPVACDPEIHKKLDIPKRYDIGFVGRDAKKFARGRHLSLLKEKYPNSFIGEADFRKIEEIYSASKIGFNSSIANDINMRIFEIMACGCFLLTNYTRNNGFDELFKDKKHLVTYKNDKELIELIEYYLDNNKERERIAEEGYKLVGSK